MSDKSSVEGILRQIRAYRAERTFAPAVQEQYDVTNSDENFSLEKEEQIPTYRTAVYKGEKVLSQGTLPSTSNIPSREKKAWLIAAPSLLFVLYLAAIPVPTAMVFLAISIFVFNVLNVSNRYLGRSVRILSGIGIPVSILLFLIAGFLWGAQRVIEIYG